MADTSEPGKHTPMLVDSNESRDGKEEGQLSKKFRFFSTLGVNYSLNATPLVVGLLLQLSLLDGGSPYYFYSFIVCFFFQSLIALSLAEMSGQIYWTASLAPEKLSRQLSYWCGCLTIMAWTFALSGVAQFFGTVLTGFVVLCNPAYVPELWHMYLLYVAVAAVALGFNTFGYRLLPTLAVFLVVWINLGSFFIFVSLLARAPKAPAQQVFVDVENNSGWASDGLVFLLSFITGTTAINSFDGAAHMTAEMPRPERDVPRAMLGTALMCGFTGLPMILVYLFSLTQPMNLLQPVGGQPILQLFVDAYDSRGLTITSGLVFVVALLFSPTLITLAASRCWWSFAQMGALPASTWHARVNSRLKVPANAVLTTFVVVVAIGALMFGPSQILSTIISCGNICFLLSYTMPIACFLFRGRDDLPEKRYFNLGRRLGPMVNLVALAWTALAIVMLLWPTMYPVDKVNMNYAVVVVPVFLVLWGVNWVVHARRTHHLQADAL
ncbi:hypothetical protein N0V82_008342 [Gnomoniopsis sp. IMI 355080]|nr:hypothetical protein N0V82_008342 [Gnomoniopsis sp. IMI 355080]